ncbi:MAG TPA: mraZ [Opitutales bacterium]|nr:mraZ [Opitutales bacterium]
MGTPDTVVYTGEHRHNIDDKGRLTLPSKWRMQGDDVYLALPNPKGFITVYPPKRAAKFYERIEQIGLGDEEAQEALFELSALAQSFGCDSVGRFKLSEKLAQHAGIVGKEVVLQGNFASFSIWSKDRYDGRLSGDVSERSQKLAGLLSKLGGI